MNKYIYFCILSTALISCNKNTNYHKEENTNIEKVIKSESLTETQQTINENKVKATDEKSDTIKIYESSEVDSKAIFPLNNSQIVDFIAKHFKYPDEVDPINKSGTMDLIINKEGIVIDVLVVKSIHPEVDKEMVRVMKLLPKFTQPAKIKGEAVCSKYRLPMTSMAF